MDGTTAGLQEQGAPKRARYARVNVTVPAALLERARADAPGLNLSGLLAEALADKVNCAHLGRANCETCHASIDVWAAGGDRLKAFWADLWWDVLTAAVDDDVTPEGIARHARDVATRHQVPGANFQLPRPSRARRAANRQARDHVAAATHTPRSKTA